MNIYLFLIILASVGAILLAIYRSNYLAKEFQELSSIKSDINLIRKEIDELVNAEKESEKESEKEAENKLTFNFDIQSSFRLSVRRMRVGLYEELIPLDRDLFSDFLFDNTQKYCDSFYCSDILCTSEKAYKKRKRQKDNEIYTLLPVT